MPDVPDAVNTQSMHLHIGACVPHRQWVSGTVKLAVLVQRHGFSECCFLFCLVEPTLSGDSLVGMQKDGECKNGGRSCVAFT